MGLSADQPLHEWTNKIYDDEERERVLALWQKWAQFRRLSSDDLRS